MIELIKHAIKIHEDNYDNYMSNYGMLPDYEFQKEFSTIHLNVGRRSGKTSSMMILAKQGDLIVVHNTATRDNLKRSYPDNLATIKTVQELYRDIIGRRGFNGNFDYVWIDEPSICLHYTDNLYDFDLIYKTIEAKLFIKLGE